MKIILLGAPGAGKGTQASKIMSKYDLAYISTGDIFRHNIKEETQLGLQVTGFLKKGELVPDDLTCKIVEDRLNSSDAREGFLLDGFPRNIFQAESLEKYLEQNGDKIDYVLNIRVLPEILLERAIGRRVCSNCKHTYHIKFSPSKVEKICDLCGGELIQRADDVEETVKHRISVYEEQTKPLIDFYKKRDLLIELDGSITADSLFSKIKHILGD